MTYTIERMWGFYEVDPFYDWEETCKQKFCSYPDEDFDDWKEVWRWLSFYHDEGTHMNVTIAFNHNGNINRHTYKPRDVDDLIKAYRQKGRLTP